MYCTMKSRYPVRPPLSFHLFTDLRILLRQRMISSTLISYGAGIFGPPLSLRKEAADGAILLLFGAISDIMELCGMGFAT
jgi:hypothetical protein